MNSVTLQKPRSASALAAAFFTIVAMSPVTARAQDDRGTSAAGESAASPAASPTESPVVSPLDAALQELDVTLAELRKNVAAQDAAWPDREKDQEEERSVPLSVRTLQTAHRKLEQRRSVLALRIERLVGVGVAAEVAAGTGASDVGPLLVAIVRSKHPDLAVTLAPVLVKSGRSHPKTTEILGRAAARFSPPPLELVKAIAQFGDRTGNQFLLELGRREKNVAILTAAANSGDPAVVGKLVDFAEGNDQETRSLALRVLGRLEPPAGADRALDEVVKQRVQATPSPEVKALLVTLLGASRDAENYDFLATTYRHAKHPRVKVATLGALGNLGEKSSSLLLAELKSSEDVSIRRACIHALGAMRNRAAVEMLIPLVSDSALSRDAVRALERISGKRHGRKEGRWKSWWRSESRRGA